ncbi:MAG: DUF433 domain-containing protein [Acetobacteraceae bacterium]|nr:DUF433 domain-containing protein [Acetobacteraceae bacterium]
MLSIGDVIAAFTEEQVSRLTGLSSRQLRYWDGTGFFSPDYRDDAPGHAHGRLYSFRNIVALRTIALLRVQHGVPLQHLRKVAETLSHLRDDLWTQTRLWVLNRKVIFENPETELPQEVVSGQYVIDIPLRRIVEDTDRDVRKLRTRSADQLGRISRARGIAGNARVAAGTRIRVDSIRRLEEDGYSPAQILAEYPDLTEADIRAALDHDKAAA